MILHSFLFGLISSYSLDATQLNSITNESGSDTVVHEYNFNDTNSIPPNYLVDEVRKRSVPVQPFAGENFNLKSREKNEPAWRKHFVAILVAGCILAAFIIIIFWYNCTRNSNETCLGNLLQPVRDSEGGVKKFTGKFIVPSRDKFAVEPELPVILPRTRAHPMCSKVSCLRTSQVAQNPKGKNERSYNEINEQYRPASRR